MNLSKLIKSLISIVLCLFLFSGCTQTRHLKDLLIVEGVGIDLTESKDIAVTLQSLKIGMSNSSEKPDASMTFNSSSNGNTVSSAINSLAKGVSKRAFFGHNKIMVLSQKFVENGVEKYVDYFLRSEDARADVAICVAKKSAKFILESKENDSNVPSENILYLINNNEESGQSILVNENDFLMLYKDETSDIYLPVVEREDEKSSAKTAGIALFCGDKLSYITDEIETKGFVILNNKADDVLFQIYDEKLGKTDVHISNIKCKKGAVRYNNNTYFDVELKADMIISEIEKGTENKLSKNDYNRILREVENEVSNVLEKTFYALIKAKSDCLRVGNYIAKDCPDYYSEYIKNSRQNYQKVLLNKKVKINLEKISDNSQLE